MRDDVQTDLNVMFLLLGGLSLVVGALGIANITLVGVMERTAEIGLRRAIGATRRHIAAQFLVESASMGIVGGLLGSSIGVMIVVGVSAYQVWTPVLDPLAPLLAPVVGGVIGLLSGSTPPRARRRSGTRRGDLEFGPDVKEICRRPEKAVNLVILEEVAAAESAISNDHHRASVA